MTEPDPRWEPGSLFSTTLERVITDALADLFADGWRREATAEFQQRHFRERLEKLSEAATGISLCGLPAAIRHAPAAALTVTPENPAVPLAVVASPHRSRDEGGAHSGHAYGEQR